jgi:RecB family exonuclease
MVAGRPLEEAVAAPVADSAPTTPRDAEAWLRRRIGDPALPAVDRLTALGALAGDEPWRPRAISEFAGVLPAGPDTGLLDPEPRLSPSQAESYSTCPRRYAFERLLRISDGGSKYADLGSLVHRVLERVERAAVAAGSDHGDIDTALAVLAEEFDPGEFDGPPWSDSWLARAQRIVTHLYGSWPGKGPAVAFESAVQYDLDGVRWSGRVDRAEERATGIHVIDYKTSATPTKVDDAAGAVQLGFYVLASGPAVTGAEFWYPGHNPGRQRNVTVRPFDMKRLPEVLDAMRRAQAGVLAEEWPTITGDHCDRCPVRIVCPEWPEGREAYT